MYFVYKIENKDKIIYIGRTNNIKRRTYQHNYNIRKGKGGNLYDYCKANNITEVELIVIREFKTKVESKRWEAYLILDSYFNDGDLVNKVPNISDR